MPPFSRALRAAAALSALTVAAETFAQAVAPAVAASAAEPTLPAVRVVATPDRASEGTGRYAADTTATATKLELSPRETPQSVSIVTRTRIDDFGLTNANDVLSVATGVNVERVEPDRTYFSVRGFEVSNLQVDGVGLPFATGDQLGDIDIAPYDRVEILRGANGLMAATGNPSATLNFVRKRPTETFQAGAGASLGAWNNLRLDGDVAGPLNDSGSVRGRLVAALQDRDAWLDRYHLRKHVLAGIVEADLAPGTLLTVGHAQQRNRPTGTMWGALPLHDSDGGPTNLPVSASTGTDWSYWNSSDTQTFAELTQRLAGGWQLQATLTRRVLESDAELLYVYGAPDAATGSGLFGWPSKYGHRETQWIGDVNARGSFVLGGRRHEVVFGANLARSRNHLHSSDDEVGAAVDLATVLAGSTPRPAFDEGITGEARFTDRRTSLYAVARLNPNDVLKLMLGGSLTRATSDGVQYGVVHDYRRTRVNPFAGLVWDLDAQHSLYASTTGIFNPQHQTDRAGAVLDPIVGTNTEVGVKGEWLDRRLAGSLALFRTAQKNTAEYAGFENGRSYYRGVDATATGYELELTGQPARGIELSAGWTQLRLKGEGGQDVRTYVPRRTLRLGANARVLPALKLGAALRWQSAIERDQGAGVVTRQDAYAVVDLMARWELSRQIALSAQLNNATDRRYLGSLLWAQGFHAAPRHANVGLNLTW